MYCEYKEYLDQVNLQEKKDKEKAKNRFSIIDIITGNNEEKNQEKSQNKRSSMRWN